MWILDLFRRKAVGLRMTVCLPIVKSSGKTRYYMLTLQDNQQVVLEIVGEDAKGNPAPLPATPAWTVGGANPAILTVTPAADGMSANVIATGSLGTAQVVVSDTVGGSTLQGILDVTVVAGDATQIVINAGTPTNQ